MYPDRLLAYLIDSSDHFWSIGPIQVIRMNGKMSIYISHTNAILAWINKKIRPKMPQEIHPDEIFGRQKSPWTRRSPM